MHINCSVELVSDNTSCPRVPNPENGQVQYEDTPTPLRPGSVIEYTCDAGYILEGAAMAVCQSNRTWSEPEPTCLPG